jgi:hypothetical protein
MNSGVNRLIKAVIAVFVFCLLSTVILAQAPQAPASSVTSRSITAIGYQGAGSTTIDLKGTGLIAEADGKARVEAKKGLTTIEAEISGLASPTRLGTEFLTYVLWAVSTEGRAINLGEVLYDNDGKGKLQPPHNCRPSLCSLRRNLIRPCGSRAKC